MKKGILLIAHGSPRQEANEEFIKLVDAIRREKKDCLVQGSFLEGTPNIPEGIEILIEKGVSKITVLPYFLVGGKHTATDIPAILDQKKKEHPQIKFNLMPHIGAGNALLPVILKSFLL